MRNFEPPESAYIYDLFGVEIYAGEEYWSGDEGIFADPLDDNWDSRNNIISLLVEQLGTRHILEALGYERRVLEQGG